MPRKPIGPKAMTAAARKREQRARDIGTIYEKGDEEWPARVCLLVLQSPRYGDILKRAAWRRLGQLNGWGERFMAPTIPTDYAALGARRRPGRATA